MVQSEDDVLHNFVAADDNPYDVGDPNDPDDPNNPPPSDETDNPVGKWTVEKVASANGVDLADGDGITAGDTVVYTITVRNTGTVALKNMQIRDTFTADGTVTELTNWKPALDTVFELPVNGSFTFTAEYVTKRTDEVLHNYVVADDDPYDVGDPRDPDDPNNPPPSDETDNPVWYPHLTLQKVITSTPKNGSAYVLGETVEYAITVTNDGNVTITDIVVTDELTGDTWTIDSLAPGEKSETFKVTLKVTKDDVKAGTIANVATAEGQGPESPYNPGNPPRVTNSDRVETTIENTSSSSGSSSPKTGDTSRLQLWLMLMILSACGVIAILAVAKKRSSADAKGKNAK